MTAFPGCTTNPCVCVQLDAHDGPTHNAVILPLRRHQTTLNAAQHLSAVRAAVGAATVALAEIDARRSLSPEQAGALAETLAEGFKAAEALRSGLALQHSKKEGEHDPGA